MSVLILVSLYAISLFGPSDCDIALRLKTPGISILWGYFGYNKTCLNRFLPRIKYLQIHPSFHATRANQSSRHKKAIYRLARKFPDVSFIVSLGLEDRFTKKEATKTARRFRREKPGNVVLSLNSTTCPRCRISGVKYREAHTDVPTRGFEIGSNDGWGIGFKGKAGKYLLEPGEIRKNIAASAGLKIFVLWYGEAQGIGQPEDRFIKPWRRKILVTRAQVRDINKVMYGR